MFLCWGFCGKKRERRRKVCTFCFKKKNKTTNKPTPNTPKKPQKPYKKTPQLIIVSEPSSFSPLSWREGMLGCG
jgi:hypothetical protein